MAVLHRPKPRFPRRSASISWDSLPSVEFTKQGGVGEEGRREKGEIVEQILRVRGEPLITLRLPWETLLVGQAAEWNEHKRRRALDAMLHLIITAHLGRKPDSAGYVPVPWALINRIVGDYFGREVAGILIALGIVETDGVSIPGERALGYRLTAPALSWGFRILGAPLPLAEAIRANRRERRRHSVNARSQYETVWRVLKRTSLAESVWAVLLALPVAPDKLVKGLCAILATDAIRRRNWFFSHDERTGRCFDNVTNYPKALRPHLLIAGRPTAEADIASAQPLFLGAMAYADHAGAEARRYLDLVTGGVFYESIAALAGFPDMPREEAKDGVQHLLFGRYTDRTQLWPAFASPFPALAGFILKAKEADYRRLSVMLQAREGGVMIGGVVPRLAGEGFESHPIHDGVRCIADDIEHVRRIIAEEVEGATGIRPLVRSCL